jgi:hypothetical protein
MPRETDVAALKMQDAAQAMIGKIHLMNEEGAV